VGGGVGRSVEAEDGAVVIEAVGEEVGTSVGGSDGANDGLHDGIADGSGRRMGASVGKGVLVSLIANSNITAPDGLSLIMSGAAWVS
jgi:uncharacterized spore protein YtfJ